MNFKERLYEINAPTLIISGETDNVNTVEDVKTTAGGIPDATRILYEYYGHNLILSNYEEVANEIKVFLNIGLTDKSLGSDNY